MNQMSPCTNKERTVTFIVARLSSSRLPGKQLRTIGDKPLIQWTIDELKKCKDIDEIVLATTGEPVNDPLVSFCLDLGIKVFRFKGDTNAVTTRLCHAADAFNAEICMLISGDCPLMDAPFIDKALQEFKRHKEADFVRFDSGDRYSCLQGIGIAREKAWKLADELSNAPPLKEHQFPILGQRPDLFHPLIVTIPDALTLDVEHRFSIDTWADLEFHNELFKRLSSKGMEYGLSNAVKLLQDTPKLRKINSHVHQMAVEERAKKGLMIIDAGPDVGYGHLMRCRELALQIIERLGWPVRFLLKDEPSRKRLESVGLVVQPWSKNTNPVDLLIENPLEFHSIVGTAKYDFTILDIYHKKNMPVGWRATFPSAHKVVILDRVDPWVKEADLVVIPGVISEPVFKEDVQKNKLLYGLPYVIIRREIRRAHEGIASKDIDLLVYLHQKDREHSVLDISKKIGIKSKISPSFKDFPHFLARSRFFLSGFGISFYEALYLKAYPVTWAISEKHYKEARAFYFNLNLPEFVINAASDLRQLVEKRDIFLHSLSRAHLDDGTPNIVKQIRALVQA